jgi:hypothetical protein
VKAHTTNGLIGGAAIVITLTAVITVGLCLRAHTGLSEVVSEVVPMRSAIDAGMAPAGSSEDCASACATMVALSCDQMSSDCTMSLSKLERARSIEQSDGSKLQCSCVANAKTAAQIQACGVMCSTSPKPIIKGDGGLPPCRPAFCGESDSGDGICTCYEDNGESRCALNVKDCENDRRDRLTHHAK